MKKLLLTITMLAMALTAQASPILLTSDGGAAAAVAGGIGILGLTWLAFVIIGVVWLIFPFVVWAKLNRIIQNTRTASENLYRLYSVTQEEFLNISFHRAITPGIEAAEKPQIQP